MIFADETSHPPAVSKVYARVVSGSRTRLLLCAKNGSCRTRYTDTSFSGRPFWEAVHEVVSQRPGSRSSIHDALCSHAGLPELPGSEALSAAGRVAGSGIWSHCSFLYQHVPRSRVGRWDRQPDGV